ncbi:MAG: hypothetical protein U0842_06235 [Candidatus Binatia bacterium]
MKHAVELMPAPTANQPGGYVRRAYAGRDPMTPSLDVEIARPPGIWRIRLRWPCPEPVTDMRGDPSVFPDAAALFAPLHEESNWITMGAPGLGVEGVLWRADTERLFAVHAEGVGTMRRSDAPAGWRYDARHAGGFWELDLTLPGWAALDGAGRFATAVWRGSAGDRGGLKSVSPDWLQAT